MTKPEPKLSFIETLGRAAAWALACAIGAADLFSTRDFVVIATTPGVTRLTSAGVVSTKRAGAIV